MAVRRKPSTVTEFIESGGAEPALAPDSKKNGNSAVPIQPLKLRLEVDLLNQVDQAVTSRRPAPSRHQWILEAIYEKLDRDGAPRQMQA